MICCRGPLQEWRLVVLMPPARRGMAISAHHKGRRSCRRAVKRAGKRARESRDRWTPGSDGTPALPYHDMGVQ